MELPIKVDGQKQAFHPQIKPQTLGNLQDELSRAFPEAPFISWSTDVRCFTDSEMDGGLGIIGPQGSSLRRIFVTRAADETKDGLEVVKLWTLRPTWAPSISSPATPADAPAAPFLLGFIPEAAEIVTSRKMTVYFAKESVSIDYSEGMDIVRAAASAAHGKGAANIDPENLYIYTSTSMHYPSDDSVVFTLGSRMQSMVSSKYKLYAARKFIGEIPNKLEEFQVTVWASPFSKYEKPFTLKITNSMLVWDLKTMIFYMGGPTPAEQRRLMYGDQLEDGKTLGQYGIKEGSILNVIGSVYGGMFHATSGRSDVSDLRAVAAIEATGKVPLEVVLPDCSTVLLETEAGDTLKDISRKVADLLFKRDAECLAKDLEEVNVSSGELSVAAMQEALHRAQGFLQAQGSQSAQPRRSTSSASN